LGRIFAFFSVLLIGSTALFAQSATGAPESGSPTLRINSRAVLVDVIVTDAHGNPVTNLPKDAFGVTEQGKPQTISFFEEHKAGAPTQQAVAIPKLPPNVFTNFSPFPAPPAVTVLLLDSLNTSMESQSFVHAQALSFLKSAKPGSRMAIFGLGLGLHFIQGFTDDPGVLAAALRNRKNNEVETSVMLKGQDETNAQEKLQGMMSTSEGNGATAASADAIASLRNFIQENDNSRTVDRALLTLANFQRLATFLNAFPGRKNVIWFSEAFPLVISGNVDTQVNDETARTLNMLAAARVALYPVDARGASTYSLYSAEKNFAGISAPSQLLGTPSVSTVQSATNAGTGGSSNSAPSTNTTQGTPNGSTGGFSTSMRSEGMDRNIDQEGMKRLAEQTGGKAFVNSNGLAEIAGEIAGTSSEFYTLSYTPTDTKVDGRFRSIEVKVQGGNYRLSYRRGYLAAADDLPGSGEAQRARAISQLAEKNPGAVDPLLPFMDLGMPQSQQILIEALVHPAPLGDKPEAGDPKGAAARYQVDFAIDAKDLRLPVGSDGMHAGTLNVSLIAYDRYGNIVSRKDHRVDLHIKPEAWAVYQNSGVQLHANIAVPKGNYWLRTGVYDQQSRKVGTMEIPLAAVKTESAAVQAPAGK
jgi:VWFA-related protein